MTRTKEDRPLINSHMGTSMSICTGKVTLTFRVGLCVCVCVCVCVGEREREREREHSQWTFAKNFCVHKSQRRKLTIQSLSSFDLDFLKVDIG